MKLLIVDDEELTRTGVISSIDWKAIGIDQILQADDGMNGLAAALEHKPDIILCDVRMPRLDGIQMLERLEAMGKAVRIQEEAEGCLSGSCKSCPEGKACLREWWALRA